MFVARTRAVMNPLMPARVIQVIVVAGLTLLGLSLLWIVLTLPVSSALASVIAQNLFDTDMLLTVQFIQVFIEAFPLLVAVFVMAWGWVRTVEERETGYSHV